jgi:hypothetical protein
MSHEFAFTEWQYPRIGSFLPLVLFVPAIWIVGAPFQTNIGVAIGASFAVVVAGLKLKNSKSIRVTRDALQLGDAVIPRKHLGKVEVIPKEKQFFERGANLDSRAFVFLKYGLPEMVRIEIIDKKDPTPYLLVSTRYASRLVSALS